MSLNDDVTAKRIRRVSGGIKNEALKGEERERERKGGHDHKSLRERIDQTGPPN